MGRKSREKAARKPTLETAAQHLPEAQEASASQADEFASGPPELSRRQRARIWGLEGLMYLAAALPFLILKAYTATPASGDENIYFYVGTRVAQGVTPYSEILFAHPPGHLLISTLWMAIASYSPVWGKLAAIFPALLTLLVCMWILRRSGVGRMFTLMAGLLLATAYDFLSVSSHFTGANWSSLLLVAGLGAVLFERRIIGGALLAAALLTSAHVAPAVLGIAAADLVLRWRGGWRTAATLAGVVLGVHLFCLIVFGDPYYKQVFGYHLSKTPMSEGGMSAVVRFFYNEYHMAALGIVALLVWAGRFLAQMGGRPLSHALRIGLGLLALSQVLEAAANGMDVPRAVAILVAGGAAVAWTWWERNQERPDDRAPLRIWPFALLTGAAVVAQSVGVLAINRVFTYYQAPLLPLLALLSGWVFQQLYEIIREMYQDATRSEPIGGRVTALFVVAGIFVSLLVYGEYLERYLGYYEREYNKTFEYEWKPSAALPGFMNSIVKTVAYKKTRRIGDIDWGITRYLWHEARTEDPRPLLPHVLAYADKPGTIFGDASTAGYFALMSGRTIAREMADTNAQLFKSGLIDMDELLRSFDADPPLMLVLNPRRGVGGHPALKQWSSSRYRLVARELTTDNQTLLLLLRTDAP